MATPSAAASRAVTLESGSPLLQRLRAHEVQPEIAVTEPEPRLAAELRDRRRARATSRPRGPSRVPRRSDRPARRGSSRGRARRACRAPRGRRRRFRSRSRRRDRRRRRAAHEPRAADAAGEHDDVHAWASAVSSASAACERGPSRRCRRWRSSSVSTSSARFGTRPRRAAGRGSRRARESATALSRP